MSPELSSLVLALSILAVGFISIGPNILAIELNRYALLVSGSDDRIG